MPEESAAARKVATLADEARRWKGAPLRCEERSGRRLATWLDLEIRQAGRNYAARQSAWVPVPGSTCATRFEADLDGGCRVQLFDFFEGDFGEALEDGGGFWRQESASMSMVWQCALPW